MNFIYVYCKSMLFLWAPVYHDRQVNLKSPSFFVVLEGSREHVCILSQCWRSSWVITEWWNHSIFTFPYYRRARRNLLYDPFLYLTIEEVFICLIPIIRYIFIVWLNFASDQWCILYLNKIYFRMGSFSRVVKFCVDLYSWMPDVSCLFMSSIIMAGKTQIFSKITEDLFTESII